jgi:hypothetical protein
MVGVDLFNSAYDPFINLMPTDSSGSGSTGGSGSPAAGVAIGALTGNWVGAGMQLLSSMFSGDSSVSGAGASSQGALNTSGWAVGDGKAEGGDLSASMASMQSWPWYVWAAGTLVAVAIIKKAV